MRLGAVLIAMSLAAPCAAGDFRLALPIDCDIGEGKRCFVQNYVDRDTGPNVSDFTCNQLSYDGHKGTDFALRSLRDMQSGVAVLAAAPGRVKGLRDGMQDRYFTKENAAELDGKDCGNGVVIDHGDGWETQYCHLLRGSVSVRKGDHVDTGSTLGMVGLSGRTQFPHVHLSLRRDGKPVDPFSPEAHECQSSAADDPLWVTPPDYQAGGIISVGFASQVPEYADIKSGTAHRAEISTGNQALVLWGYMFGSRPGDILHLEIRAPSGTTVLSRELELEKAQAQLFRAVGRKTKGATWFHAGTYEGDATLIRDRKVISSLSTEIQVTN